MALPDQLADLERKVSARFSEALAEIRQEMRRAVEAEAQRASSAMLSNLDAIARRPPTGLLAAEDLLELTREAGEDAPRPRARACARRSSSSTAPRPRTPSSKRSSRAPGRSATTSRSG